MEKVQLGQLRKASKLPYRVIDWLEKLTPIAAETTRLLADPAMIDAMLRDGARRAAAIADPIVAKAEDLVGFLRV